MRRRKKEGKKRSKNKIINTEERKLSNFLGEKRWSTLNGNTRGKGMDIYRREGKHGNKIT